MKGWYVFRALHHAIEFIAHRAPLGGEVFRPGEVAVRYKGRRGYQGVARLELAESAQQVLANFYDDFSQCLPLVNAMTIKEETETPVRHLA